MNKKLIVGIAIVFLAAAGIFALSRTNKNESTLPPQSSTSTSSNAEQTSVKKISFDPRNATYDFDDGPFTLVNGVAEVGAAPGSASKVIIRYFGNEASGDLNGDGQDDMAFLITRESGGSGLFYYIVAALRTETGYKLTNPLFIGDRIAPQTTAIPKNSMEIQVNYAERKPGEPMTAQPSVGVTKLFKVTSDGVLKSLAE